MNWVIRADARRLPLASGSVHCIVTSPPFWAMRRYPEPGSIGHEPTFADHVQNLLQVFRELRRVLRHDGDVTHAD